MFLVIVVIALLTSSNSYYLNIKFDFFITINEILNLQLQSFDLTT